MENYNMREYTTVQYNLYLNLGNVTQTTNIKSVKLAIESISFGSSDTSLANTCHTSNLGLADRGLVTSGTEDFKYSRSGDKNKV